MNPTTHTPTGVGCGVVAELAGLVAVDVAVLDRAGLDAAVAGAGRVRAWLDGLDVRCARRAAVLAAQGTAAGPETTLTDGGRRSGREAHAVAEREQVCTRMPGFEAALDAGEVSAGHVDAIARATSRLDEATRAEFHAVEADLLAAAGTERVEVFERRCNDLARHLTARTGSDTDELERQRRQSTVKRWVDTITGMHHTHLTLDPLRDAALWSAANNRLTTLRTTNNANVPWEQLKLEAFIGTIQDNNPDGSGRVDRVPEATVLIDYTTLIDGLHDNSVCGLADGTPIPVTTMRRLLCDCEVLPVVLGGDGVVLDLGRSRRTATREQRRALRAMHRTCIGHGCTIAFDDCHIHHIRWWWRDHGHTDIDQLAPLCDTHHHLVHEGHWTLTLTHDRIATWTRPDGTTAHHGPTINRTTNPSRTTRSGTAGPDP